MQGITKEEFMITAAKIHEIPGDLLHYIQGPLSAKVLKILPPENATPEALVFVSKADQLEKALKQNASIVIAHKSLKIPEKSHACFFTTPNVQLAIATVGELFDKKIQRFQQEEHIHPKSAVHPTARLGKNVIVGPCAVIGAEAHIGDNSIIGANSVIESHVHIGHNTIVHPLVYIGTYCQVGSYCEIHPHTAIGADGFGFVALKDSHPVKIPQLGRVVIGDHVEIGAGCTVDRASMTETILRSGVKLDSQCHIAHNCELGENSRAAGGFMMAGSSKLGKNFLCGGSAVISDHVNITDDVMIAGLSGVTKDITEPGQYGGYPLQPLKDSLKTLASTVHLLKMRKQVSRILKHLNLSEEE
jgi:UDP-3-O-[3-hydroxymyristoyl] glucosamine N-acyltransferase